MSAPAETIARGRPSTVLALCRQCVEYIYEGTTLCPHCGGDPQTASDRYREGGFAAIEAMRRIDALRARGQLPPTRPQQAPKTRES